MEDSPQFEQWLYQCLKDSREKLGMTDQTLAYILLREGTACYHRFILGNNTKEEEDK